MKNNYYESLDILRFISVLFVIMAHTNLYKDFDCAGVGVRLFFVLSGFLITTILIEQRKYLTNISEIFSTYNIFLNRRFLRLIPIYYITLILTKFLFADSYSWSTLLLWYFTYLSNIHILKLNGWPGFYSHLWTLAIEEQFYLIWPIVIFFTKQSYTLFVFLFVIAIGVLGRTFFIRINGLNSEMWAHIFTTSSFDSLGFGALLAYCKPKLLKQKLKTIIFIYFFTFVVFLFYLINYRIGVLNVFIFQPLFLSVFCAGLVLFFLRNDDEFSNCFLIRKVKYMGKITYGIYLFHNFIFAFIIKGFQKLNHHWDVMFPTPFEYFLMVTILSVFIADLSWRYIEKWFLSKKLQYQRP